jgi:hypothetical protein
MCDVLSVAELAEDYDLEEDASPTEFLTATAEQIGAEVSTVESAMIDGYPAVLADMSGDFDGIPYQGALVIIVVENQVVGVWAMISPDQWEAFRPTFIAMVNSLSFEP